MTEPSISHDQKFKELISTFFMEFLELFLPELARTIEPDSVIFREQACDFPAANVFLFLAVAPKAFEADLPDRDILLRSASGSGNNPVFS
jgi:hypothetical protein